MTWLPFYKEVVQVLATYEDRQNELIELLREMQSAGLKTISLDDLAEGDITVPLEEIDPFSFLATFHRTGDEMRVELWKFLREKWNIGEAAPQDFGGLPTVMANASRFFSWQKDRPADEMPALWSVFQQACSDTAIAPDLWTRVLEIGGVGVAKLTSGLFWTNAEKFLSLDGVMLKYLARYGIKPDLVAIKADYAMYQLVLAQVHEALGYDHIHLSREAWETRNAVMGTKRYWAGGHDFGEGYGGQQKDRFLQEGVWQANFLDEDQKNLTNQMRALFSEIQIGDEFAIKGCGADNLKVHVIGRVIDKVPDEYLLKLDFLAERPLYRGKRPVGAGAGNWTQTLLEVKRPEDIELIFHGQKQPVVPPRNLPPFPLNQILYGPPGTGKTYSSIARAVEIIDGVVSDDRDETVARFDELRAAGCIGFVTFHQSFAYEEFIEGLRPIIDDNAAGTARYEISDGVFKQIALRALAVNLQFPSKVQDSGFTFDQLWEEFLSRIKADEPYEIAGVNSGKYRLDVTPRGTIYGENIEGNAQRPYNTSRGKVREVWEKLGADEKPTNKRLFAILERGAHTNLIGAIVEELRRMSVQDGLIAYESNSEPAREVSSEDAREWLDGASEMETGTKSAPRFVLIVDEINRGNIAKIFGELITLLEEDKRLGSTNELRVTLPYSKETFGVPSNLYLLGTMNTADKSLALLDIALRRRFEFEELRPNFGVCENLDDTMRGVLQALNARLMRALDREHRLGHAPWIDVHWQEEWNRVFLKQIVPLLQEYFYNDWENLRAVLGEKNAGVIVRELPEIGGVQSRTRYGWWFDCDENCAVPDFLQTLAQNFGLSTSPQEVAVALEAAAAPESNEVS